MGEAVCISHSDMNAAFNHGAAVPIDTSVPWLVRYRDGWWVVYPGGWVKITSELAIGDLGPERPA